MIGSELVGRRHIRLHLQRRVAADRYAILPEQQSCPWVGLGWVEIFQFLVGWVHCSKSTKKIEKIMLMHLKHDQ